MNYKEAARNFVENEQQFHLGAIPTEQSNPLTRGLSAVIKKSTTEGVKMLLSADERIAGVASACFKTSEFARMVEDIQRAIETRHMVLLSSVGASGRLALQLDSSWRKFWQELGAKLPLHARAFVEIADCVNSIMTGGDRACVRSVENFEDYMTFGAQQVADAGVGEGDVVLALAECGLSASIIGSAIEADERACATYYLFCNPEAILCQHLERARAVFAREKIVKLPLYVGPMAVAGSTRMQVTTIELLVAGAALELGSWAWLQKNLTADELCSIHTHALTPQTYADEFERLVKQLSTDNALCGIADAIDYEYDTYRQGGLITYCAHAYLQDVFTDTTERQPTFTLPPYRKVGDTDSPVSWAYAKDPLYPSGVAWQHVLRRPVKGLDWVRADYLRMGAAQTITEHPPAVGSDELSYYLIGNEDDPARYSRHPARLICVSVNRSAETDSLAWYRLMLPKFDGGIRLEMGEVTESDAVDHAIRIPIPITHTLMELPTHLMVKLVFNLLSTATMAKMGRVWSNWMTQVLPTNKKLIDRSIRIIAELARIPYETA
ncbi:MAG: hypothetical protein RSD95_16075, partial [Clostridia bacterium]